MVTFLQESLAALRNSRADISESIIILPSKRAGGFLMNELKKQASVTHFAPQILSIEEFIEEIANLSIIDPTELIFKSYKAYLNTASIREKETFENYATWALTLLNDFNEVDRYLIEPKPFFEYLANIKTLERWGVEKQESKLVSSYLQFWEGLPSLYNELWNLLKSENLGYQGMVYREAANNISAYIAEHGKKHHVFIGFNALNAAEQKIIQQLLKTGNSETFWDTDQHFYEDSKHSASYFIRKYIREWSYYEGKEKPQFPANFTSEKDFKIVEVQKNVGQAKYVGELLTNFSDDKLNKTAIVLGDENLLVPVLNSLPSNVNGINVTMGVPLKNFPATVFFELLFNLQLRSKGSIYYKDVLSLLSHPIGSILVEKAKDISNKLTSENITHPTPEILFSFSKTNENDPVKLLFENWNDDGIKAMDNCLKILKQLNIRIKTDKIEHLVIQKLMEVFGNISALAEKYPYLNSVKTVLNLFSELANTSTLDFEGNAYNGPQIMGVLETRVLDFEHLVITSVNEGVFPSGKSNTSFITYDLKQEFQLPLYTEKDAIYTYHFYRMLQRAKTVTLLYNAHSDGINSGEKSRFVRQLEFENNPNHNYEKIILSPSVTIKSTALKEIQKTEQVLTRLKEIAKKGFSPSALTSYIRNPIDFYFQKILKLSEYEEVEENIAANTLGTIVHDTLEAFYKPLEGQLLSIAHLEEMKGNIPLEVTKQFQKTFRGGTFSKGKNLIVFEVAKRYILNFITLEIADVKAGNQIKIEQIETKLTLNIPIPELDFEVNIGGIVDRVDRYNGKLRIIDYKTGSVQQTDLEIIEWESLTQDYKYSKAFQVLAYAAMISKEVPLDTAEGGIISFKNLNNGFLKFATKASSRGAKDTNISQEVLSTFFIELKRLILEICDQNTPFIEKEIER
ncbi:PD-(D/E)XK nuclease family protein [Aequorivita viscosa]|uniref:PD-(D/E)XK nuclease superfamily protein n=1 Tax=Aequorivita viscosa TaxID=797419 RepID=A0A1M6HDI9_9FLAO|nr:PD-(D/E)XK nuclease family protein [Aequorivita viscosa]SDW91061.1 PD-(D/E)XK nuclease superfamily protein [Aequorivita viscosa]SHJ20193.1 PD-(D/E)XK nuclease superfamily protein [Aequorivita viscosa]